LVKGFDFEFFLADKGYDAKDFLEDLKKRGAQIVVPSRSNRKEVREYDKHIYRERHKAFCILLVRSFGSDEMSTEPSIDGTPRCRMNFWIF
jgi:transposase